MSGGQVRRFRRARHPIAKRARFRPRAAPHEQALLAASGQGAPERILARSLAGPVGGTRCGSGSVSTRRVAQGDRPRCCETEKPPPTRRPVRAWFHKVRATRGVGREQEGAWNAHSVAQGRIPFRKAYPPNGLRREHPVPRRWHRVPRGTGCPARLPPFCQIVRGAGRLAECSAVAVTLEVTGTCASGPFCHRGRMVGRMVRSPSIPRRCVVASPCWCGGLGSSPQPRLDVCKSRRGAVS